MPYQITKSDGTFLTMIPDNTVNSSATSLALFGQGMTDYGDNLDEDLLYLLENFASPVAPVNPIAGQIWFNVSNQSLYFLSSTAQWIEIPNTDQSVTFSGNITATNGSGAAELNQSGNLYLTNPDGNPTIFFQTNLNGPPLSDLYLTTLDNNNLSYYPGNISSALRTSGNLIVDQTIVADQIATPTANINNIYSLGNITTGSNQISIATTSTTFSENVFVNKTLVASTNTNNQLVLSNLNSNGINVIHRNDGSTYYILFSNAGDNSANTTSGGYNTLRPLYINLSNGIVSFGSSINSNYYNFLSDNSTGISGSAGKITFDVSSSALGNITSGGLVINNNIQSTGKFLAAEGAGTSGGYTFTLDGSQDTGMFSPSDGVLNFYTNGVLVGTFQSGNATFFNLLSAAQLQTSTVENNTGPLLLRSDQYIGSVNYNNNAYVEHYAAPATVPEAATILSQFPLDRSGNGYTQLPNGLILQWGTGGTGPGGSGSSGVQANFFPTVFPNACVSITISITGSPSFNNNYVLVQDSGTNAFYAYGGNLSGAVGGIVFYWMAIGF